MLLLQDCDCDIITIILNSAILGSFNLFVRSSIFKAGNHECDWYPLQFRSHGIQWHTCLKSINFEKLSSLYLLRRWAVLMFTKLK